MEQQREQQAHIFEDALTGIVYEVTLERCVVREAGVDISNPCPNLFFVGCALLNHGAGLALKAYELLQEKGLADSLSVTCCGKVLQYRGNPPEVLASYKEAIGELLHRRGVKRIITACPNCTQTLRAFLEDDASIQVVPLPKALCDAGVRIQQLPSYCQEPITVHDSCPDRGVGEFAQATRTILEEFSLVEMEHHHQRSTCCGSRTRAAGKTELCYKQAAAKEQEAIQAGAASLVTACMSCASLLSHHIDIQRMPVFHYLELLFDDPVDWSQENDWTTLQFFINTQQGDGGGEPPRSYALRRR